MLPTNFVNLSWQSQYNLVLNKERTDRQLTKLTTPIARLSTISIAYAKTLNDNNAFTHTYNGTTPISRMQSDIVIKDCMEYQPYSESLFYFSFIGYNFVTEKLVALQGLYNFLYNDSSSNWGHRKHLLGFKRSELAGQRG